MNRRQTLVRFLARPIVWIFLLALAVRMVWILPFLGDEQVADARAYENIARDLHEGKGLRYEGRYRHSCAAYYVPLYFYYLAGHYIVFGYGSASVQISQAVLGALTAVVGYFLGRVAFTPRAGVLAGTATAVFAPLVMLTSVTLMETLFTLLVGLATLIVLLAVRSQRPAVYLGAGAAAALACLTRGQGAGLVLGMMLLSSTIPAGARGKLRSAAAFGLGAGFVFAPWIIRNAIVLGAFIPLSTQGMMQFGVDNGGHLPDGLFHDGWNYGPYLNRYEERGELGHARALSREGWEYIAENPRAFLKWAALRQAVFWDVIPIDYFWPYKYSTLVRRLFMYAIFLLAAVGVGSWRKDERRGALVLVVLVLAYALPWSFFAHNSYRIRTPVDGLILVLAAAGLSRARSSASEGILPARRTA